MGGTGRWTDFLGGAEEEHSFGALGVGLVNRELDIGDSFGQEGDDALL